MGSCWGEGGSVGIRPDLNRRCYYRVLLQEHVFDIVLPVGMRLLLPSDEVDQQLTAADHILDIEQFPTYPHSYPSCFCRYPYISLIISSFIFSPSFLAPYFTRNSR